jgi:hypothetical protein
LRFLGSYFPQADDRRPVRKELDIGYIGLPPAMIEIGIGLEINCYVLGTVLISNVDYHSLKTERIPSLNSKANPLERPGRGSSAGQALFCE